MITIRQGSRVHELMCILACVGEFPMRSIHLLGDSSSWGKLIQKLAQKQDFRFPEGAQFYSCRMLTISGTGKLRSIRLYKAALPLLERASPDAYRYYMEVYGRYNHTGKENEIARAHRVAETAAMCSLAEIQPLQYELPPLQTVCRRKVIPDDPSFYISRELKSAGEDGGNRTKFSRITGAIFYRGGCYAVYNSRDALMKWNGQGEMKTKLYLAQLARMNADLPDVDSAVMLGSGYALALRTLASLDGTERADMRFDRIYQHIHFIPMNSFGVRLLRILTVPDWHEKLMQLLFDEEDRSYNQGTFEYDAVENGICMFSFLDSDIVRLSRFRSAVSDRAYEILCFLDQVSFLRKYLGNQAALRVIELDLVEAGISDEGSDDDG